MTNPNESGGPDREARNWKSEANISDVKLMASREDNSRLSQTVAAMTEALEYYAACPWVENTTGNWQWSNYGEKAKAALSLAPTQEWVRKEEMERLQTELGTIQRIIRDHLTDDVIDRNAPAECVAILGSQRDNAYNELSSLRAKLSAAEQVLATEKQAILSAATTLALAGCEGPGIVEGVEQLAKKLAAAAAERDEAKHAALVYQARFNYGAKEKETLRTAIEVATRELGKMPHLNADALSQISEILKSGMNSSEINRAVAEWLGWHHFEKCDDDSWAGVPPEFVVQLNGSTHRAPPDFFYSLDAMATAEATLTDEEYDEWRQALGSGPTIQTARKYVSAPANLRAIAFLAVKGGK